MGRIRRFLTDIMAGAVMAVPAVSCTGVEKGIENGEAESRIEGWGQPLISVACMRDEPRHGSELVSQCLLGVPVAIWGREGEWLDVMTPEGYRGWVNVSSIAEKSEKEMEQWRSAERYVVDSPTEVRVYADSSLDASAGVVTDLVDGCIVEGGKARMPGVLAVTLPDGRSGYADVDRFIEIGEWSNQSHDVEKIISRAEALMGVPYLWGGLSTKSMDCSGLVKLCYWANGIVVLRDASQQAQCGEPVDRDGIERGDLLFFGNAETGRVTHVGIYEGDSMYVHSSGRVRLNSLDHESPDYMEKHYLSSRRLRDAAGTEGVTMVRDHPWFF
ncbi:MAG: C40 family peptidase [Muribaculaceae bacterium]|nr:C40 family peptidase [Muribaculaceae bacterium]